MCEKIEVYHEEGFTDVYDYEDGFFGTYTKETDVYNDHSAYKKDDGDYHGKLLYCSFCGISQHEVRKLIAGPSVFICDECIDLCNDIIREEILDQSI